MHVHLVCFRSRLARLLVVAVLAWILPVNAFAAAEDECGPPATQAEYEQEAPFTRYIPDPTVAPNGSQLLEFTYSNDFLQLRYNGDPEPLEAELDSLAWSLCDEIDNPFGIQKPDLALIHDLFHPTAYRPYEYGDPWFADPTNGGGKFLLDQAIRYMVEESEELTAPNLGPIDNYDHIDIIFVTSGLPHYPEAPNEGVADAGEGALERWNGITMLRVPTRSRFRPARTIYHELAHLFDFTSIRQVPPNKPAEPRNRTGFGAEPRANVGRRYVGTDFTIEDNYGSPINKCYYRDRECDPANPYNPCTEPEPAEFDYAFGRGDSEGEWFWAYLAASTSTAGRRRL